MVNGALVPPESPVALAAGGMAVTPTSSVARLQACCS
jgi:hypothetical protein